jgi:exodeoxyribonuclease X
MTAYIFDTERTDRDQGEIIEAAWLHMRVETDLAGSTDAIPIDMQPGLAFCQRYKPSKLIAFGSMAVHHILPGELEDCFPSSEFALPSDCAYLIGHSIDFDWQAAGSPANVKRIDTHAIAQWLWPDTSGHSQSALLYMLLGANTITREQLRTAHGALPDAWNNLALLREILRLKPEITTWSALWEYSEQCRIPMFCPFKNREGVKLVDLDDSYIDWCLSQHWIDAYLRKGLVQIAEARASAHRASVFDDQDFDDSSDFDDGDDDHESDERDEDFEDEEQRW